MKRTRFERALTVAGVIFLIAAAAVAGSAAELFPALRTRITGPEIAAACAGVVMLGAQLMLPGLWPAREPARAVKDPRRQPRRRVEGRKGMYPATRTLAARLAVGALALLISAAAVVAFTASPAQATGKSSVDFAHDCDGTTIAITSGTYLREYEWTVTLAGEQVWPGEADAQPAPGDSVEVQLPPKPGEIAVDFERSPKGWPKTSEWTHPGGLECGAPTVTLEGGCDQVVLTYSNPTEHYFSGDYRVDDEAGTPDQWSDMEIGQGPHAGELFGDRYQQVDLPPGQSSTVEVGFGELSGEHLVEAVIRRGAEQEWYAPWVELTVDCGQPSPSPTPTSSPAAAAGSAGELPETGSRLPLLAGLAVLLFAAGGVLVWRFRRRIVSFRA